MYQFLCLFIYPSSYIHSFFSPLLVGVTPPLMLLFEVPTPNPILDLASGFNYDKEFFRPSPIIEDDFGLLAWPPETSPPKFKLLGVRPGAFIFLALYGVPRIGEVWPLVPCLVEYLAVAGLISLTKLFLSVGVLPWMSSKANYKSLKSPCPIEALGFIFLSSVLSVRFKPFN